MFVEFCVVLVLKVHVAFTVRGAAPHGLSLEGGGGGGPQAMVATQPAATPLASEVKRSVRQPLRSVDVIAGGSVLPEYVPMIGAPIEGPLWMYTKSHASSVAKVEKLIVTTSPAIAGQ